MLRRLSVFVLASLLEVIAVLRKRCCRCMGLFAGSTSPVTRADLVLLILVDSFKRWWSEARCQKVYGSGHLADLRDFSDRMRPCPLCGPAVLKSWSVLAFARIAVVGYLFTRGLLVHLLMFGHVVLFLVSRGTRFVRHCLPDLHLSA